MLEQHYLTSLFEPKSVAVIGASDRENSVGNVIFKNILNQGYKGKLYAINPKHETIQGQPAYKSIEEIGARVETAIIATRPQTVPPYHRTMRPQRRPQRHHHQPPAFPRPATSAPRSNAR